MASQTHSSLKESQQSTGPSPDGFLEAGIAPHKHHGSLAGRIAP